MPLVRELLEREAAAVEYLDPVAEGVIMEDRVVSMRVAVVVLLSVQRLQSLPLRICVIREEDTSRWLISNHIQTTRCFSTTTVPIKHTQSQQVFQIYGWNCMARGVVASWQRAAVWVE